MKEEMTTREFIKRYLNGDFESQDVSVQIEAGWYDWFCKDKSLLNKTRLMGNIISKIKDGGKVDLDKTYVFFKNNCPCNGNLYDDFRICDIETGNVLINVNILNPWRKRYAVYGRFPEGDFWSEPYVEFDGLRDLVAWLNTPFGKIDEDLKLKHKLYDDVNDVPSYSVGLRDFNFEHNDADLILHMQYVKCDENAAIREELLQKLINTDDCDVVKQIIHEDANSIDMTLTFRRKKHD